MTLGTSISDSLAAQSRGVTVTTLTDEPRVASQSALRQRICAIAGAVLDDIAGTALRALVLTGSVARDEAGFDIQEGRCKVRGDAEFLVVLHDHAGISAAQERLIRERVQTDLGHAGIDCSVSVGFVRAQYLVDLRPHIFGYELKVCGVVVMGEPDILGLIPPFSPSDIPLEDGWQLLANRITEFLEYAHEWIERPQAVSAEGCYRMVKLYLDMATSFLLFESAYEPTYSARAQRLERMARDSDGDGQGRPFRLQDFSRLVSLCSRFKTGHNLILDEEVQVLMQGVGSRDSLTAAVGLAHGLWRWELSKLVGAERGLSDRQLMERWMKLQPFSRRLPGWGYVLRHEGWYRSWRQWPRWARIAWKASPRYWTYLVASELLFGLATGAGASNGLPEPSLHLRRRRSCLVLKGGKSKAAPVSLREICSEIVLNYREFLEVTRA